MRLALLSAAVILLACCPRGNKAPPSASPLPVQTAASAPPLAVHETSATETRIEMVNVNLHLDSRLILRIRYLVGKFLPTRKGCPPTFDDKLSYIVAIDSGEVGISMASMAYAVNTYVFGEPDAPLKNLQLCVEGSQIEQKGTLKKGIGIPFEMVGDISVTTDGRIRIHPTQMKAAHLPLKGILRLFKLDMATLINTRKTRGVSVEENDDIILDPSQMLPPPKMRGRVSSVRIQGDEIIQTFGKGTDSAMRQSRSNYIAYRGGALRFGRLTMDNADMRL